MADESLRFLSAREISEGVRSQRLSAVAVLDATLAHIKRHNPKLNAVVELLEEAARAKALDADRAAREGRDLGPLHGVPVLLKDVHRMRGSRSTYGLPQFRRYVPESDSWIAERLRRAGAVIVGRTNVPVAGFDWQTWNPNYGRTNNPWDLERTPGGSSGGSAAAIAAGFVPLDIGSDLGGSIRLPSHFCGVLGLRPTDGLVPNWRLTVEGDVTSFRNLLTSGPMARTMDDLELGLRVVANRGYAQLESKPLGRPLRIAWVDAFPGLDTPLGSDSRQAFHDFLKRLEKAGHHVERALPDGFDAHEALLLWGRIVGHEFVQALPLFVRPWLMRAIFLGPLTMKYFFGGSVFSKGFMQGFLSGKRAYVRALTRSDELRMDFNTFFDRFDAWIAPVSPDEAIHHCRMGAPIEREGKRYTYSQYLAGWTGPLTTLGHPILTLPIARLHSGLPISVQVSGPRFGDLGLLNIGRTLSEQALPIEIPSAFRMAST